MALDSQTNVCLISSSQGAKLKNVPAFKAALLAAAGIIIGKQFPDYSYLFLVAAVCAAITALSWFLLRRERVSPIIAGFVYAALSFSFAFYMSVNISSLLSSDAASFSCFVGTVEETPRDTSITSAVIRDCYGYNKRWHRIGGDLILSPAFKLRLSVGDRIAFTGRVDAISSARNPGDFDLKSYYELSGIVGRIYVKDERNILWVNHSAGFNFF